MQRRPVLVSLLLSTGVALPTFAVETSHWVHTNPTDFKPGKFEHVVATNLGDLKLSRDVKQLLEQDQRVSVVYCLAEAPDGTVYAGTGPQGVLLAIKDGKVSTAATLKDGQSIFSLLVTAKGNLLLGTGGNQGRILELDKPGEEPKELLAPKDVQYIWSLRQTPDGNVYAATGPTGQLYELIPSGDSTVLYDSDENNLVSLVSDGKDLLFAGTDPEGLVYRINRRTKDAFVLYDASEKEVSALALSPDGTLYAATSDSLPEDAGATEEAATEIAGRPESDSGTMPIPSKPPADPAPPPVPDPNPGRPDPIPKSTHTSPGGPGSVRASSALTPSPGTPGEGRGEGSPSNRQQPFPTQAADAPSSPDAEAPKSTPSPAKTSTPEPTPSSPGTPVAADAKGNAIYRIDRDGFVTEVFRANVMILSLLEHNGTLLVGTGSEGEIYQVSPSAEETVVLAKVDPKQVMSLLAAKDGQIYLGLANTGGVGVMSSGFAKTGTYTSPVLDATQISRFGKINMAGSLPEGTSLTVSTRSGNLASPDAKGWSDWTEPAPAAQYVDVKSASARFLQYRLNFATTNPQITPVVDQLDVAYGMPNLAPRISLVRIKSDDKEGGATATPATPGGEATPISHGTGVQTITWEASDPNTDSLIFELHYRRGPRSPWIRLKDDLHESTWKWDTRTIGDGEYEIRVTASDESANPLGTGRKGSRVSDPIFVDNTPPAIGDLKWIKAPNAVRVQLRAVDRARTVAKVEYAVDSSDHWQAVLPSDNMFDSPEEAVVFTVPDLKPGQHQIAIRATDAHGNQGFESLLVTVDEPAR